MIFQFLKKLFEKPHFTWKEPKPFQNSIKEKEKAESIVKYYKKIILDSAFIGTFVTAIAWIRSYDKVSLDMDYYQRLFMIWIVATFILGLLVSFIRKFDRPSFKVYSYGISYKNYYLFEEMKDYSFHKETIYENEFEMLIIQLNEGNSLRICLDVTVDKDILRNIFNQNNVKENSRNFLTNCSS